LWCGCGGVLGGVYEPNPLHTHPVYNMGDIRGD